MLRLPLGRQDFRTLRDDGLVYVDKTEHLCTIARAAKYNFLARPRRFGKSLSVSTYAELYSGDRELFRGLWAYEHWDFAARHSAVIRVDFSGAEFEENSLSHILHSTLDTQAEKLRVDIATRDERSPGERLRELIVRAADASPSGKVVVLIDEYDKPIVHFLGEPERARAHRDALKGFYGVLKALDAELEFVFLTGVSAFSKVSLFSDLNNMTNLTFDPLAATTVGLTEGELDAYFDAGIRDHGVSRSELRHWYNGYRFSDVVEEKVYNPWSVLSFLRRGQLESYWYETGTPTWLLDLMAAGGQIDFSGKTFDAGRLASFSIGNLDLVAVLYQTGYLTITDRDARRRGYRLDYPNYEVQLAFERQLLAAITADPGANTDLAYPLLDALEAGDVAGVIAVIDATLASIPYHLWDKHRERTYHIAVHVLFRVVGSHHRSEVASARGRADAIVETDDHVFCFEFKVDGDAGAALAQIRARGYLEPYADRPRERVAVGVSFDSARRRVGAYEAEVLPEGE